MSKYYPTYVNESDRKLKIFTESVISVLKENPSFPIYEFRFGSWAKDLHITEKSDAEIKLLGIGVGKQALETFNKKPWIYTSHLHDLDTYQTGVHNCLTFPVDSLT